MAEAEAQAKKGVSDLDKALNEYSQSLPQVKKARTASQKKPAPQKRSAKKRKVVISRGKRKEAIARASTSQGSGVITINGVSANLVRPKEIRDLILEPIIISKDVADMMKEYDVRISVNGGGIMGQAQASRTALARAIVETTQDQGLRKAYMTYVRSLLVEDHRRVEPKKMNGPKARARNQTSYR